MNVGTWKVVSEWLTTGIRHIYHMRELTTYDNVVINAVRIPQLCRGDLGDCHEKVRERACPTSTLPI